MANEDGDDGDKSQTEPTADQPDADTPSFRDRVEELRDQRGDEGDGEGEGDRPDDPFGEGAPGMGGMMGGGGGGGNPMAQMMSGMMGGGPGGGPPGMGGGPSSGQGQSVDDAELVREVRNVRDEVHDIRRTLERIADALEE